MMVLSRTTFDTFWQIMVGFRPANLKLRSLRVWITFLAFYVLNTESERISKKYVFNKHVFYAFLWIGVNVKNNRCKSHFLILMLTMLNNYFTLYKTYTTKFIILIRFVKQRQRFWFLLRFSEHYSNQIRFRAFWCIIYGKAVFKNFIC